jgi:hypothetical protein
VCHETIFAAAGSGLALVLNDAAALSPDFIAYNLSSSSLWLPAASTVAVLAVLAAVLFKPDPAPTESEAALLRAVAVDSDSMIEETLASHG